MSVEVPQNNNEKTSRYRPGARYDWPVPNKQLELGKTLKNEETGETFTAHPFTVDSVRKLAQELPPETIVLLQGGVNGGWFDGVAIEDLEQEFKNTSDTFKPKMKVVVPRG